MKTTKHSSLWTGIRELTGTRWSPRKSRVAEAVREEVGAERMYLYTFGSNQGNAHVHWHVVPLPPGMPYEDQQGALAGWDSGVLEIPQQEMFELAGRIGRRL